MSLKGNNVVDVTIKAVVDGQQIAAESQKAGAAIRSNVEKTASAGKQGFLGMAGSAALAFAAYRGISLELAAVRKSADALFANYKRGVEFNATLQDTKVSIASVLKAMKPEVKMEDFAGTAAANVKRLREAALDARVPIHQLAESYVAAVPAMTHAGIPLKDQPKMAAGMMTAARTAGVPEAFQGMEMREVLTGNITRRNMLANILGINSENYREHMSKGDFGKFLTEKLKPFQEGAKLGANTFHGAMGQLAAVGENFSGNSATETTKQLTEAVNGLVNVLSSDDAKKAADYLDTLGAGFVNYFKNVVSTPIPTSGKVAAFAALGGPLLTPFTDRGRKLKDAAAKGEAASETDEGFTPSKFVPELSSEFKRSFTQSFAREFFKGKLDRNEIGFGEYASKMRMISGDEYKDAKDRYANNPIEGQAEFEAASAKYAMGNFQLNQMGADRQRQSIDMLLSGTMNRPGVSGTPGLFQSEGALNAYSNGDNLNAQAVDLLRKLLDVNKDQMSFMRQSEGM